MFNDTGFDHFLAQSVQECKMYVTAIGVLWDQQICERKYNTNLAGTGNTVVKAINVLKEHGVKEENVILLNLFCTPQGKQKMLRNFWLPKGAQKTFFNQISKMFKPHSVPGDSEHSNFFPKEKKRSSEFKSI